MGGARHFDHCRISVNDLNKAVVDFYTNVLGLSVLRADNDIVYLGCGRDEHFDIALTRGEPSLEHSALRLDSSEEFERIKQSFDGASTRYDVLEENEPGINSSIAFEIPSGARWEVVMAKDSDYYRPTKKEDHFNRPRANLFDVDHIGIYTASVQKDCEFFRDVIGMRISDVRVGEDGSWKMAFVRLGSNHHDIALFFSDKYQLSHIAWNLESVSDMVRAIDHIVRNAVQLEIAPYRHYIGSNMSCYFRGPDNLRMEFCTEMATLNDNTPPSYWTEGKPQHSAWGGITVNPSFWVGI